MNFLNRLKAFFRPIPAFDIAPSLEGSLFSPALMDSVPFISEEPSVDDLVILATLSRDYSQVVKDQRYRVTSGFPVIKGINEIGDKHIILRWSRGLRHPDHKRVWILVETEKV